jgi:hypothetical protein
MKPLETHAPSVSPHAPASAMAGTRKHRHVPGVPTAMPRWASRMVLVWMALASLGMLVALERVIAQAMANVNAVP